MISPVHHSDANNRNQKAWKALNFAFGKLDTGTGPEQQHAVQLIQNIALEFGQESKEMLVANMADKYKVWRTQKAAGTHPNPRLSESRRVRVPNQASWVRYLQDEKQHILTKYRPILLDAHTSRQVPIQIQPSASFSSANQLPLFET